MATEPDTIPKAEPLDPGGSSARTQLAIHHLAAIVASSDDAIISKTLEGIVQSWNGAAERIFGFTASEMIGKPIQTIIPPERHAEEDIILGRIKAGERIDHFETVRRAKDGTLIDISLTVSPIRTDDGQIIGASNISRDIRDRRQAEASKELLLRELKHRVKNMLAAVQAMANQSFRSAPESDRTAFSGRLRALADAHDLLTQQNWAAAAMDQICSQAMSSFLDSTSPRVFSSGSAVDVPPNHALLISMLLHEIGTNAVKYGALSNAAGQVHITWSVTAEAGRILHLQWQECDGPVVRPPERRGLGSRLIERALGPENGSAQLEFRESGVVCEIRLPLASATSDDVTTPTFQTSDRAGGL